MKIHHKTNSRIISSHWYWESASVLFRPDKVSKSLIAHFWDSKLLMITVRLSARHSAPAEPLPVAKVTNPGGRGGEKRRLRHQLGALDVMVYMRHQRLESNKSNQELRVKKAKWCWMFWDWDVQRQHNQNTAQTQAKKNNGTDWIFLTSADPCRAGNFFFLYIQIQEPRWACSSLTFEWAAL